MRGMSQEATGSILKERNAGQRRGSGDGYRGEGITGVRVSVPKVK